MRVAHYTRQGAGPCRMAMLRQQAEYSVKPRRTVLHCNRLARRAAPCPPKRFGKLRYPRYRRFKIEGGAFFFTLAPRRTTAAIPGALKCPRKRSALETAYGISQRRTGNSGAAGVIF
jgi:hypothetical protein